MDTRTKLQLKLLAKHAANSESKSKTRHNPAVQPVQPVPEEKTDADSMQSAFLSGVKCIEVLRTPALGAEECGLQIAEAIMWFEKVMQMKINDASLTSKLKQEAAHYLLFIYMTQKKHAKTIPVLTFLTQFDVQAYYNLGVVYLLLEKKDQALEMFIAAKEMAIASHNAGVLLLQKAKGNKLKIREAEAYFENEAKSGSPTTAKKDKNTLYYLTLCKSDYGFPPNAHTKLAPLERTEETVLEKAMLGDAESQFQIAKSMKTTVSAYNWYTKAAAQGHPGARAALLKLVEAALPESTRAEVPDFQERMQRPEVKSEGMAQDNLAIPPMEKKKNRKKKAKNKDKHGVQIAYAPDVCVKDILQAQKKLRHDLNELENLINAEKENDVVKRHISANLVSGLRARVNLVYAEGKKFEEKYSIETANEQPELGSEYNRILQETENLSIKIQQISGDLRKRLQEQELREEKANTSPAASEEKKATSPTERDHIIYDGDNVFYPVHDAHNAHTFFKFNRVALSRDVKKSTADEKRTEEIVDKIENGAALGRILLANSKKPGITIATDEELDKFPDGYKFWIRADQRVPLHRHVATDDQKERGIEYVFSPRGKVLVH